MPLESCMILLDNSEYMRNGDYIPTRLEAQHDAANMLVSQKTQSNPESTVGVIAMSGGTFGSSGGGGAAELLCSPTDDMGKILSSLHGIPVRGPGDSELSGVDIAASVQVASLALKHRRNKNGQQRVVLFVGSPLTHVENRALIRAGKLLKKNNVAIDVVAMGELEENEVKLKELVDAANGSSPSDSNSERTCHLVSIPPGVLPSDVLIGSPVVGAGGGGRGVSSGMGMGGASGAGGDMGGAGGDSFADIGVDPNMDPELAMALRVSMEEERARQERIARAQAESAAQEQAAATETQNSDAETSPTTTTTTTGDRISSNDTQNQMDVDETETGVNANASNTNTAVEEYKSAENSSMDPSAHLPDEDDMADEDALLQQALAMSMAEAQEQAFASSTAATENKDVSKPKPTSTSSDVNMDDDDDDDDAAMQMALQMSMQNGDGNNNEGNPNDKKTD
mmetsp:Transcript_4901/g.7065  ORF Transcript_4901/g.7065 Transcript_4901/m.7065 type:complete len:454 (+) Transcript_4901:174-1535(+)|eukprot:CAMPEP_0184864022 /NCGR_PEP_ID=MMETSP0580-20130426/13410_1 /TAXON_ID=1118495 /ORGANISM="Dactyliosolen fragilissimus" /LENGTH=453 /DNA_ID=CAMNT_0027362649 /DNA_START=95 /DNA_END=1456 /DNA_ORIENTATION=-